jgi:hypothetical protein
MFFSDEYPRSVRMRSSWSSEYSNCLCDSSALHVRHSDSRFAHPHAPAQQAFAYSYGGNDDEWKLCKGYCKNRGDCYIVKEKYWHDRLLNEDADRDLLSALEDADEFDERGLIEEAAELDERGLIEEDAETVERDLKSGKYKKGYKGKNDWKYKKYKKYQKKYFQEKKKPVCELQSDKVDNHSISATLQHPLIMLAMHQHTSTEPHSVLNATLFSAV